MTFAEWAASHRLDGLQEQLCRDYLTYLRFKALLRLMREPEKGTPMVRCKLRCNSVVTQHGTCNVVLNPIWDPDPKSPNFRWSTATPSGEVKLTITNPGAFEQFREGQFYFADFEPCSPDAVDKP
jgi:hypothetical protein